MQENKFSFPKFIIGFNLLLIIIFPVFVEVFFGLKYSKEFAIAKLQQKAFEKIIITDNFLANSHHGFIANQHVFLFQAEKNSQFIEGRLTCYRTIYDLKNSRCIFSADFL